MSVIDDFGYWYAGIFERIKKIENPVIVTICFILYLGISLSIIIAIGSLILYLISLTGLTSKQSMWILIGIVAFLFVANRFGVWLKRQ